MNRINLFSVLLVVRVLVLLALSLTAAWVFYRTDWIYTQIILYSLIAVLVLDIMRVLHKTNQDLDRFLTAMKYGDFDLVIDSDKMPKRYRNILDKMSEIKEIYHRESSLYNLQEALFMEVIGHLDRSFVLLKEGKEVLSGGRLYEEFSVSGENRIDSLKKAIPNLEESLKTYRDSHRIEVSSLNILIQLKKINLDGVEYDLIFTTKENEGKDNQDFEAWVNFGKVFSHEILNGITPIASMSSSMKTMLKSMNDEVLSSKMNNALDVIQERCLAIQQFSEKYRTLNKMPDPDLSVCTWQEILDDSIEPLKSSFQDASIHLEMKGDLWQKKVKADKSQLGQVLSNIHLNAKTAVENVDHREIHVHITEENQYFRLEIEDSGIGVEKDLLSHIFVPFFTTKEEGSGIGLSVARQILWKHRAEIKAEKSDLGGLKMLVRFPKI